VKRLITGDLSNPKQQSFQSKVLTNESGLRILQLALKAGHIMPEHASRERVTVVSLRGVVRFTEGTSRLSCMAAMFCCSKQAACIR
jgi:quercetin dioxygenase-like cupin family protein